MTGVPHNESRHVADSAVVVDFALGVVSEAESQFRFNSDGIFVPRETAVLVRCALADMIHGQAAPDDITPCTLVVFDFQLDRIKATRVIHQAIISLSLPEGVRVRKGGLSPGGKVHYNPQVQNISRNTETSLSVGFSQGASVEGGRKTGQTITLDTTDYASVNGWTTRHPKGRVNDVRPHNCIKWVLLENPARPKDGVPPHFRAAVLLERYIEDMMDTPFDIEMEIKSTVDLKTSIEDVTELLGRAPRGCLKVDPNEPSTNYLREYDTTRLASVVGDIWRLSSGALETEMFSRDFVQ